MERDASRRAKWSSEEDHFVVQIGERVPLTIYRNSTGRCVPAVKSYCWLQSLAGESHGEFFFNSRIDNRFRCNSGDFESDGCALVFNTVQPELAAVKFRN